MECKQEGAMLQLELYVNDIDETASLFTSVFDLVVIEEKPGWRHLRHSANYDIMLFAPATNVDGESHWPLPENGAGGAGIEIVICTSNVADKVVAVRSLGYNCSDLRFPPWGSIEFLFRLREGYLLRIKQPPKLSG
jgi:hypothetical protein